MQTLKPSNPKTIAQHTLLACVRSQPDPEGLEPLLRAGLDWTHLLDLGRRHGLLPLAHAQLRHLDHHLVPLEIRAQIRHTYYANLRRIVRLQADLAQIVTALHGAGLQPIVLKGGALAGTVYPDPGLRPMVDLDLLVPTADMARAGTVLADLGFHLSGNLSAPMLAFQQRFGGGLEYLRHGHSGLLRIDLQHDLVGVDLCRHAFPIDPDALWTDARPLALDRGHALQLSAEDTLIHLCLHPALHHGYASPLIGYVDIDRLLAHEATGDFWTRLANRAARFRARTAVYHALRCAHDLLGTPVPAGVLAGLAPPALRRRLVACLAPLDARRVWTTAAQPPTGLHQLLLYAALMERPRDALRMLRAILFPDAQWLAVRYGLHDPRQARRYRLIHPCRVARAFVRGLHRPLVQSSLE